MRSPRTARRLPMTNKLTSFHPCNLKMVTINDAMMATTEKIPIKTTRILRILLRRVSSGSVVETIKKRSRKFMMISRYLVWLDVNGSKRVNSALHLVDKSNLDDAP